MRKKPDNNLVVWLPREQYKCSTPLEPLEKHNQSVRLSTESRELKMKNLNKENSQRISRNEILIDILNKFVFYVFLFVILSLNFLCLIFLPFVIKSPKTID